MWLHHAVLCQPDTYLTQVAEFVEQKVDGHIGDDGIAYSRTDDVLRIPPFFL